MARHLRENSSISGFSLAASSAPSAPRGARCAEPDPCQPQCRLRSAGPSPGDSRNGHTPRQGRRYSASAHLHQACAWEHSAVFPVVVRRSGRPAVRSAHTSDEPSRPPAGAARGLQVSPSNVLQHLLLERQISNQLLKPVVLLLEPFQPLRLVNTKATVFL